MASEYIIIARNEVLTQIYDYAPENNRKMRFLSLI